MNKAHAFTTASHRCLQHHRIADFITDTHCFPGTLQRLFCSGNYRYPCGYHTLPGSYFIAHSLHCLGTGTNKNNPFLLASPGKFCIFGQETISRMNGIGTTTFGYGNNFFNIQITVFSCCSPYRIGFISIRHMVRGTIRIGKDRYSNHSHFTARTHHTQGNLTSVGYQYFLYHFLLL